MNINGQAVINGQGAVNSGRVINGNRGAAAPAIPWWLAGGIPASTNYTIYDPLVAADLAGACVNLANPGTRNAAATSLFNIIAANGAYNAASTSDLIITMAWERK